MNTKVMRNIGSGGYLDGRGTPGVAGMVLMLLGSVSPLLLDLEPRSHGNYSYKK